MQVEQVLRSTIWLLLIAMTLSSALWAQAPAQALRYELVAGERGYELPIEVINRNNFRLEGVNISVLSDAPALENLNIEFAGGDSVAAGDSMHFTVLFDVSEKANVQEPVTLLLGVNSSNGTFDQPELKLQFEIIAGQNNRAALAAQFVYVLSEIEFGEGEYAADGGKNGKVNSLNALAYVERKPHSSQAYGVYETNQLRRCIDCPSQITLGQPIHLKLEARERYDNETYHCNARSSIRPYMDFTFFGRNTILNADAMGRVVDTPSCAELGLELHPDPAAKKNNVFGAALVYSAVPITVEQGLYLNVSLIPAGLTEDSNKTPVFHYTGKYDTDGELSRQTLAGSITLYGGEGLLKTPEKFEAWQKTLTIWISDMKLIYTLQVNNQPAPLQLAAFKMPAPFNRPPLGGSGLIKKTADKKSEGLAAGIKTEPFRANQASELPALGQATSSLLEPSMSVAIADWLAKARPLGAPGLRFDQWGRFIGRTAGGVISTNGSPDDVAGRSPEQYVWHQRDSLTSRDHCTLGEYVQRRIADQSIEHCKGRGGDQGTASLSKSLPDVRGMAYPQALARLRAAGLVVLPPVLGSNATRHEDVGKVETIRRTGTGSLPAGSEVIPVLLGEAVQSVEVPEVLGLGLREAVAVMKEAGFAVSLELGEETRDPNKEGRVARQTPRGKSQVEPGTRVKLRVYALTVEAYLVPGLQGLSVDEASSRLQTLGLGLAANIDRAASHASEVGRIYQQNPQAGTEVAGAEVIKVGVYGKMKSVSLPVRKTRTGPNWDNGCNIENTGGTVAQWQLRDPPPYSGLTLICNDRDGQTWILGNRVSHIVLGKADRNGCYPGGLVKAANRDYRGKLCRPTGYSGLVKPGQHLSAREKAIAGLRCPTCEEPRWSAEKQAAWCDCAAGCLFKKEVSNNCLPIAHFEKIKREREATERAEQRRREDAVQRQQAREEAEKQQQCQQYLAELNRSVVKKQQQWLQAMNLAAAYTMECDASAILKAQQGRWSGGDAGNSATYSAPSTYDELLCFCQDEDGRRYFPSFGVSDCAAQFRNYEACEN